MGTLTTDLRALVTGASSGIGAAYARALRARGERLILVARRAQRLEELARELGGEEWAAVFPLDISTPDAARRLVGETESRGFGVDLLVNNAGLGQTAPFLKQGEQVMQATIDVNVRALVALTRAFLPAMIERGRGGVVNVASNAAFQPVPFLAVYAASKAFVLSFTEALAEEVRGTGVKVQALCPGITATEFLDVSQTHPGLLVRRMPTMRAEEVVRLSLAGLERGRVRVTAGLGNRAVAFVQRYVPSSLTRRVAGALYRPPGGVGP
jgi:short-subunit dehydrogenase